MQIPVFHEFIDREIEVMLAAYKARPKKKYRYKPDPAKKCALVMKRNAAKLKAIPKWADLKAVEWFYIEAKRLTQETGTKHVVDHIFPLQSKLVCGLHCEANLQILTASENCRKHNKMPSVAF